MPYYSYYCNRCDLNYSDLRKYEERDKKLTCPECGKRQCPLTYDCSKNADGNTSGPAIRVEGGTPKFYKSSSYKTKRDNQWISDEIKTTKDVIKGESGVSPYSAMRPNYEYIRKEGGCEKVSKEESNKRKKKATELVQDSARSMSEKDLERAKKYDRSQS
jgi:putative FmdB family regulatory protein